MGCSLSHKLPVLSNISLERGPEDDPHKSWFSEPQGAKRSTNWNFVGRGNGAYDATPSYSYVGHGRGDWVQKPIVTYRCRRMRPECAWLLGALLLAFALAIVATVVRSHNLKPGPAGVARPAAPMVVATAAPTLPVAAEGRAAAPEVPSAPLRSALMVAPAAPATTAAPAAPATTAAPAAKATAPRDLAAKASGAESVAGEGGKRQLERFDCTAGFSAWEKKWPARQQRYCCAKFGRGCPLRSLVHWDCDADFSNWVEGWSITKKVYCCKEAHKGCLGQEPLGKVADLASH